MNKIKWREVAFEPMFNLECFLDSKDKTIEHLQSLIDKTTNYYLKTLAKMEVCQMRLPPCLIYWREINEMD